MTVSRRHFVKTVSSAAVAMPFLSSNLWASEALTGGNGPAPVQGNPIIIGKGVCDPQIRVYDGHVYLYATRDASPDNKWFTMDEWWVWHSTDLVNWEHVSTLKPEQTYWGKPSRECWATDAARRNGKYYFYFSRGPEEIGVVTSDTPRGPWTDPLGKPLIARKSTPTEARDPGILQESDGTSYIVFGTWDFYIAKLNEDMISLAETPRLIDITNNKRGPYGEGKTDDKPFLHRRGDTYYLSWGCYYATADNPYGPYSYKDSIIKPSHTDPEFAAHNVSPDYDKLTYDRHGSFFELNGQWYFACNDQEWPGTHEHYRDSVISYVHYFDNGDIAPVDLTLTGVGQYDALAKSLPAANFFNSSGVIVKQCPNGGFEVRSLIHDSFLYYPNVHNVPENAQLSLTVSCAHSKGCKIEVRKGGVTGTLLGQCEVRSTGGWSTYQTVGCQLKTTAGTADICLVIVGHQTESLRISQISFS